MAMVISNNKVPGLYNYNPDRTVERSDGSRFKCCHVAYVQDLEGGNSYRDMPVCLLDCLYCQEQCR